MAITITRKRMKSMRMSIEPSDGAIKISAPKRVTDKQIQAFVDSKKDRIEKTQAYYAQSHNELQVWVGEVLLHGINYHIEKVLHQKDEYIDHDLKRIASVKDLSVESNLINFYKSYGKKYLIERLQKHTEIHGLTVAKVTIRGQKTKWWTCTAKGNIWLNWKLVKMPHKVAEYVICHELAHLAHLNHSQAFWQEVERLCPEYREAEKRIKRYGVVYSLWKGKQNFA